MEARYYVTCLWPGLPELWWRGKLSALPLAIGFAVGLNLLLVTRYIYPQWMSGGLVTMATWIGVFTWIFYVARTVRELPGLIAPRALSEQPDRFPDARAAYLAGNWTKAEGLLTDVLAIEPRDPPALLLLTGVYRHTDRLEAAEVLLQEIARLEIADSWWLEIEAEVGRLKRAIDAKVEERPENEETAPAADLTEGIRTAA